MRYPYLYSQGIPIFGLEEKTVLEWRVAINLRWKFPIQKKPLRHLRRIISARLEAGRNACFQAIGGQ